MKKNNKPTMLYLTHGEYKAICIGLAQVKEDFTRAGTDPTIPFNPQARKEMGEIMSNVNSAIRKIENLTGLDVSKFEPYRPGDEDEFLTKES